MPYLDMIRPSTFKLKYEAKTGSKWQLCIPTDGIRTGMHSDYVEWKKIP